MKILKALISDGSNMGECDAIEYEGGLWLVPQWLEAPFEGYKIPARIIRFDTLKHHKNKFLNFDFQLQHTIPQAVLDGQTSAGYEIREKPDIRFSIPKGVH
jgi:hypothetical protein